MKPLNKMEREYAADRIGVIWIRDHSDNPKDFRQDARIPIPQPIERYHEIWDVIGHVLKLAGVE